MGNSKTRMQKRPEQLRIMKATLILHNVDGRKMVRNLKPTASTFVDRDHARRILDQNAKQLGADLRHADIRGTEKDLFDES